MMYIAKTQSTIEYPKCSTPAEIRERYDMLLKDLSEELLEEVRHDLDRCAHDKNSTPEELLAIAKRIPAIEFLFMQDARIPESYTIEEHTSMVLSQLDKYLSDLKVDCLLTHAELRIAMLFHDIGKSLPDEKKDQHLGTLQVMSDFDSIIPLSDRSKEIMKSLIGNDPVGRFLVSTVQTFATMDERKAIADLSKERSVSIEELQTFVDLVKFTETNGEHEDNARAAIGKIVQRAEDLSVDPQHLLNLHLVSYQADTLAYTYDSVAYHGRRAYPGLDFIYLLNQTFSVEDGSFLFGNDPKTGLVRFSEGAKEKLGLLKV